MNPSSRGNRLSGRPRTLAATLALLGVGAAFAYVISNETPVGSVRGDVTLLDLNRSLDGVEIELEPERVKGHRSELPSRHTISGKDGRFQLTNVPAGMYRISASAASHQTRDTYLTVDEGKTTPVALFLTRSESDLALKQHQHVFGTEEKPHLPVSGYVDATKPAHTDTLHLRVFQTKLSTMLRDSDRAEAFRAVGRDWDAARELPGVLLKPKDAPAPVPILTKDVTITGADREGFYYQKIPFDHLKTGLYLVDIKHQKQSVCTWLLVTDTALIAKRAGSQVIAFAADMKRGTPIPGCTVRAYRDGQTVLEKQADARGLAELNLPGATFRSESEDAARMTLVALRGDDEAVVSESDYRNEGESAYVVHAYTERPIYRPGQRLYFKGIVRKLIPPTPHPGTEPLDAVPGDVSPRYTVPSNEPVSVELRSPGGERILQTQYRTNRYGSFFGDVELSPEAPTGVYTLTMKVRGTTHTHDIVIASYRKPEFAVTVTPDKKRYMRGDLVTMTVSAQYYFGAPVAGAKIEYNVYRSPDWAGEYEDDEVDSGDETNGNDPYFYHNRGEAYYGTTVTDGKMTLDENGKATIQFRAEAQKDMEGIQAEVYTASIVVKEGADREVSEDGSVTVTAGDFRLFARPDGYVATPGQPATLTITVRDYDKNPVPNTPVELEWGFEMWKGEQDIYHRAGMATVTTGPDGKAQLPVTPAQSGELVVKAKATDSARRLIRAKAYLWVTDDRGGDLNTQYTDLSLLPDKRRYRPGETARVLINTSHLGQTLLLTIEGERVYRTQTLPITQHSTVVRVPLPAEYSPNITLSACYIQDKHFASSDAALRVQVAERELRVAITTDRNAGPHPRPLSHAAGEGRSDGQGAASRAPTALLSLSGRGAGGEVAPLARYQPGEKVTYHVTTTDAQGHPTPCEFSFAVVDEAIYALREDDPTALKEAFYPRRTNRVQTVYSFAVEYLGDADKAEPKITARKKFPDTAFWEPCLQTDAQGQATVTMTLPDNLTTWRATAQAQTLDTQLGRAIQKILTKKDFLVRVQTPRFLTQRDQSQVVAIVHNDTGAAQTALVRLRADNLALGSEATQTLQIAPGQTGQALWNVTAEGFGAANLRVTAWTPREGTNPVYTDGVELSLPIRAHGREDIVSFAGELTPANPETEVVRLDSQALPALSHLTVRITPSVAGGMFGAVDYLIGYPYGCTEQTMSRFLPDLLVQRALRTHGIANLNRERDLPRMVKNGLQRLYRFQHRETGGWGWWEHDTDDVWMTAYVLYGLATAQNEGYPVSTSVLANGRKAAAKMLEVTGMSVNDQAFLLYALALAGDPKTAATYREKLRPGALSGEGAATLVLLDKLLGRATGPAFAALNREAITADGMLHWNPTVEYDNRDREATAMALRAYLAVAPSDSRIGSILRWLMLQRTGDYWGSTRATSWTLAALCDYLTKYPETEASGEIRVRLNGRLIQTYTLTPAMMREPELILRVPAAQLRADKNDVTLERVGGAGVVFYSVQLRQTVATEDLPALTSKQADGIVVKREYLQVLPRKVGTDSWSLQTEPTNNRMQPGENLRVRLTITVPRDIAYVLIEDPFPSGCEVSERGDADETVEWGYWWSSVDVRDDRIAFFARHLTGGEHIIEYNLRAQTPGSYHVLPTLVQGMYAPELRAETAETRVEVH